MRVYLQYITDVSHRCLCEQEMFKNPEQSQQAIVQHERKVTTEFGGQGFADAG